MKHSFDHAPDFSLPSLTGLFRLSDLNGRNRIALFFPRNEETALEALAQVESAQSGWQERDLLLVLVLPPQSKLLALPSEPPGVRILHDEHHEAARTFGVENQTAFFLLGKSNFPVALFHDQMPSNDELFALIDAMPMRQREMHAQTSQREPLDSS